MFDNLKNSVNEKLEYNKQEREEQKKECAHQEELEYDMTIPYIKTSPPLLPMASYTPVLEEPSIKDHTCDSCAYFNENHNFCQLWEISTKSSTIICSKFYNLNQTN